MKQNHASFYLKPTSHDLHRASLISFLSCLVVIFFSTQIKAQDYFLPLNREWNLRYEPFLNSLESKMHTSMKPYRSSEIIQCANLDSLNAPIVKGSKFNNTRFGRKLRKENLIHFKEDEFIINANFLFDFKYGNDFEQSENLFTNTRGAWIYGTAGKRFSFSSTFFENQSRFPAYIDTFVSKYSVVPGEGRIKTFKQGYDYSNVSGTIAYNLSKHFNFQFGQDKNFIGDGYRSLLLSDNANSYPFLKISTTAGPVRYMNLYAVMQDLQFPAPDEIAFKKKYASMHYLDINLGKYASIGILEGVIWKGDSSRATSFDINYINPFIFFRPVEFSLNSPDNVVLGFNLKIKITPKHIFYSQFIMDEFKLKEVKSGKGWYANKQALQVGIKTFDLFLNDLDVMTEFNYVRPFMYAHRSTLTNYAHFNQALAHPLGSNFYESVSIINYRYKNYLIRIQGMYALMGSDTGVANLGGNIYKSTDNYTFEYGNRVGQGLQSTLVFTEVRLSFLINPTYNFLFDVGMIYRRMSNKNELNQTQWLFIGIRTALSNRYHDF